ncbi:MAG: hypothetical protein Q4D89_13570, partial [Arachnia propionica]|uniref:hypothetical protein n=1 Tax=Arachnia propionica TaxID=1750 RepID=UPI0027063955|nr:hypothetical protein [Arachnia propionica]
LDSCAATSIADTAYIATTTITPIKKLPRQPRTNHDKRRYSRPSSPLVELDRARQRAVRVETPGTRCRSSS